MLINRNKNKNQFLNKIELSTKNSFNNYHSFYKSQHWERYDLRKKLYIKSNLFNFRNNKLSDGLDDQNLLKSIKKNYRKLIKITKKKFLIKNLLNKNIGNLKNFETYEGKILDFGQLFFIYWLYLLKQNIKKTNFICEIGSGYGGFAEKILRNYPGSKYLIIDLPEANFLSSYFLSKNFPNKNILLAYEKKREIIYKSDFDKYDIIIIPPWFKVRGIKFDLFINTRSMMEMDKDIIFKYFEFIQNNISDKGYFFNVNRYFKNTVKKPLKLIDYPYDNNWNTIISQPSFQQRHIRILLTQRSKNPKKSIQEEFKKIKKITEKYFLKEKSNKIPFYINIYYFVKRRIYLGYKYLRN
jgi:putative sugar O-methyltransferase